MDDGDKPKRFLIIIEFRHEEKGPLREARFEECGWSEHGMRREVLDRFLKLHWQVPGLLVTEIKKIK